MSSRITGGVNAYGSLDLPDLFRFTGRHSNLSAESVSIASSTLRPKHDPVVVACLIISQQLWGLVHVRDDQINVSVIVEISKSHSAAGGGPLNIGSGQSSYIAEMFHPAD